MKAWPSSSAKRKKKAKKGVNESSFFLDFHKKHQYFALRWKSETKEFLLKEEKPHPLITSYQVRSPSDTHIQPPYDPWPLFHFALCYSQYLPHIRGEVHLTRISSHHMTLEYLLLVESESIHGTIDKDLIVHGLTSKPFTCNQREFKEFTLENVISSWYPVT